MKIVDNYSCTQRTVKVKPRSGEHQGQVGTIFGVKGSLQHGPRMYNVEFDNLQTAEFVGSQLDLVK